MKKAYKQSRQKNKINAEGQILETEANLRYESVATHEELRKRVD